MSAVILNPAAALGEVAGCFAFWSWLKLGRSPLWLLPGLVALAAFAWLLAQSPAACGGVYIAASLLWLWRIEGQRPDGLDLAGAALCLIDAALILWGPRTG